MIDTDYSNAIDPKEIVEAAKAMSVELDGMAEKSILDLYGGPMSSAECAQGLRCVFRAFSWCVVHCVRCFQGDRGGRARHPGPVRRAHAVRCRGVGRRVG